MAKAKLKFGDDDDELLPVTPGENKFPVDIQRNRQLSKDYLIVPIDQLVPFKDKRGSDFARHNKTLSAATIESMKQDGVIEAISVRPNGELFEILAGESRWLHARAAGLEQVTVHVIRNCDDDKARRIFAITNLLRRDMSYRDKINGWWHFYIQIKEEGRLQDLRSSIEDSALLQTITKEEESLSFRQIMRDVKMHDLISEWIDRLDAKKVTQRAAEQLANFNPEVQALLLPYSLSEDQVKLLRKENEENPLTAEDIATLLKKKKERTTLSAWQKAFNRSRDAILKTTQLCLKEEDYERAEEVLTTALRLYYEQQNKSK